MFTFFFPKKPICQKLGKGFGGREDRRTDYCSIFMACGKIHRLKTTRTVLSVENRLGILDKPLSLGGLSNPDLEELERCCLHFEVFCGISGSVLTAFMAPSLDRHPHTSFIKRQATRLRYEKLLITYWKT